uniref:Uncharacterized protein n=1 Tax=Plectus sambesii TaxID=2011161 RepID=A0A914XFX1_9BILA
MAFNEPTSTPIISERVLIIIGVLFVLLILILIGYIIYIFWIKKKDEGNGRTDGVIPSPYVHSTSANNYMQVPQPSQSVDAVTYTSLQRRMDKSFAQIKELEDRIDLETSEECQNFYNLQDGFDKARSRLDIIEYTIKSDQSAAAKEADVRRQESIFSRSSRGTTNASFRYADGNQRQNSRQPGPPPYNYQTASASSYDRRQASFPR